MPDHSFQSVAMVQGSLEEVTVIPKPFPFNEGILRKCNLLTQVKRISKLQDPVMRFVRNDEF